MLCQKGDQEEGEEYELEENSRRADEQGADLREKGEEGVCVRKGTSLTCVVTISSSSHLTYLSAPDPDETGDPDAES